MKVYASRACIVFKMWMSIFAIATKQSERTKKKNRPCVQWDKCSSMNMIDFSQEDDDEIQIGIEHKNHVTGFYDGLV